MSSQKNWDSMKNPGNAWEIPGNMVNQGKHLKSWEIPGYFSSIIYTNRIKSPTEFIKTAVIQTQWQDIWNGKRVKRLECERIIGIHSIGNNCVNTLLFFLIMSCTGLGRVESQFASILQFSFTV